MPLKVPFHIRTKPLGEAILIKRGISWGRNMERDIPQPGSYPVLRIPNIQERLVLNNILYLTGISTDQARRFGATKGWTVMVGSNGNPDRVGNAVFIDSDAGFLFASFLIGVAPADDNVLDPKFLFHYVNSPAVQQAITDSVQGTTGLKNLSQHTIANLPLPCFDVGEQRTIAEMLDTAEDAITCSDAVIAKLRLMKAGLTHDLLTRGLADCGRGTVRGARMADRADLSAVAALDIPPLRDPVAHPDQFKQTPIGLVPKCWDVRRLDGVGTWMSGGTPSKSNPTFWDGDIPWVTPKDMKVFVLENTTDYLTAAGASSGSRIAPTGSIFIVVRGMILAHTFPVCLAPRPMAFNQDVKAVLPDEGVNSTFLAYWFVNAAKKMIGLTTEATHGTKRFDMADIYACQIALPHPDEQAVIVNILEAYDARLRAEEVYRDKLVLQKQGLMADLLTGRVRLSR